MGHTQLKDVESYLADYDLKGVKVIPVAHFEEFKVDVTPTLLLVNKQGVIERSFLGEMSENNKSDLRSDLGMLTSQ